MKTTPAILLILSVHFHIAAQTDGKLPRKPETVKECFDHLDQMFDDTSKYHFMTLPEDHSISMLHHGFGTWIRNNWGLWGNSALKKSLVDSGMAHPDDMSSVILKAYHRKLNDSTLSITDEAQKYERYWKLSRRNKTIDMEEIFGKRTSVEDLLLYFQVQDSVMLRVYAPHKKRETGEYLPGYALIVGHDSLQLKVKLYDIEQKDNFVPERTLGEEFSVSPLNCTLLPTAAWLRKQEQR